ncbi:DUF4232 domain-containing protein [Streptomyces sp. NPDC053427]|uniref:DUF4232 domain-containing protein n=1 Tax=Streptomyces sp. NPDC053427 TaxID=3365701 RepID=UPI0037D672DD
MPRNATARHAHGRTLRIAAAGLTAVAALSLTACGSQDAADALQTRPAKPVVPAPLEARYQAAEDGADRVGAHEQRVRVRHTACDTAEIRIVAKPLTRPVNHFLLEATNTSGSPCDLYAEPYLRFDDAQSPLAELPDSKPQAVVTLAPGASGYAAVMTSSADGSGRHGRKVTSLSVGLRGRDGKGSVGDAAKVALPGGSVFLDDSAWVTYWQSDPSDAAAW